MTHGSLANINVTKNSICVWKNPQCFAAASVKPNLWLGKTQTLEKAAKDASQRCIPHVLFPHTNMSNICGGNL